MADKCRPEGHDYPRSLDPKRREADRRWDEQDKVEVEFEEVSDEEFRAAVARAEKAAAGGGR